MPRRRKRTFDKKNVKSFWNEDKSKCPNCGSNDIEEMRRIISCFLTVSYKYYFLCKACKNEWE